MACLKVDCQQFVLDLVSQVQKLPHAGRIWSLLLPEALDLPAASSVVLFLLLAALEMLLQGGGQRLSDELFLPVCEDGRDRGQNLLDKVRVLVFDVILLNQAL